MKPEIVELKQLCLTELDRVAVEHPKRHQGAYGARYVMRATSGKRIEIMFDKGERSPANLWVCEAFVGSLEDSGIQQRRSPANSLNRLDPVTGKTTYGRHAGLLSMEQLSESDLVCFTLSGIGDLHAILAALKAA